MIYKNFKDLKLSALGLGCMRLPLEKGTSKIDITATSEMVDFALKNGINYFDTAWGYHEGKSETVMGEILSKYPRDSFYLASKFPGYDVSNMNKVAEIFPEQLRKCQVEYFDFYLYHCLNKENINGYLDENFGIHKYLTEQKRNGKIKHLGFSAHADFNTMTRFLDAYGKDLEFCQLQINWFDWEYQEAEKMVELVRSYNIPIWVMEPVRGGALINIAPEYKTKLKSLRPNTDTVEWAFRFIQTIPDVVVTLSGMSNFEQLKENIDIFKTNQPLNDTEIKAILDIGKEMTSKKTHHCTACRYCTAYCPLKLDIPSIIKLYNKYTFSSTIDLDKFKKNSMPSSCIGCKSCEAVCPQNIKISEMMKDFAENLK